VLDRPVHQVEVAARDRRDVLLRPKSYLFAGSHEAAARTDTAGLYNLIRTRADYRVLPLP
jgi:hypothetical protein